MSERKVSASTLPYNACPHFSCTNPRLGTYRKGNSEIPGKGTRMKYRNSVSGTLLTPTALLVPSLLLSSGLHCESVPFCLCLFPLLSLPLFSALGSLKTGPGNPPGRALKGQKWSSPSSQGEKKTGKVQTLAILVSLYWVAHE
jgi:hypothetical protein